MRSNGPRCCSADPLTPRVDQRALLGLAGLYGFDLHPDVAERVAGALEALLKSSTPLWEEDLEHVPLSLTLPDPVTDDSRG